jgi:hypothetical protein
MRRESPREIAAIAQRLRRPRHFRQRAQPREDLRIELRRRA